MHILNQKNKNKFKQTIDLEMQKIEEEIKLNSMSQVQKIRKELQKKMGKDSRITEHDINKKLMEKNTKNLTAIFQVTSRE